MSPDWDRQAIVDWLLTFLAVVTAASLLADAGNGGPSHQASLSAVRELEFRGQMAKYPDLSAQMGVGEVDVLTEILDSVIASDTTPAEQLLVAGTVALAVDRDKYALEALDQLAERSPEDLETIGSAAVQLADLAKRRVGPTDALRQVLTDAGGSKWLQLQLTALHADRHGDPASAKRASDEAQVRAFAFVESVRGVGGVGFLFCMLGCLLIVFWPMVRRALDGAGAIGLGQAPSPFILATTHRIMVVWFLGHVGVAATLSTLALLLGQQPMAQALNVALQSLLGGGLALWLIQSWGRRDQDMVALWVPLRLALSPSTGGIFGLVAWTLGGLSMGLVLVISGTILSALTMGENQSTQSALELFSEHGSFEVRAALTISAVVFAPIFEEILFRGFLYRNLRDVLGRTPAMLVTGFLFGLVHLDLNLILPLSALGFTLCLLYERSGSLLPSIFVHAAWNLSQLVILTLLVTG